jgi:hypothetical protein
MWQHINSTYYLLPLHGKLCAAQAASGCTQQVLPATIHAQQPYRHVASTYMHNTTLTTTCTLQLYTASPHANHHCPADKHNALTSCNKEAKEAKEAVTTWSKNHQTIQINKRAQHDDDMNTTDHNGSESH